MCGIFLYKSKMDTEKSKTDKLLMSYGNKCSHRGPDNTKVENITNGSDKIYMMFHRLSINGLSNEGNQPIHNKGCTLMCNGEIYNYKELAKEYGVDLVTGSDCEIIIHLYHKIGYSELLNCLDGVFSFVLYDSLKQQILIGHDPFGIRSLYWFHDGLNLGISSEMKCLVNLTDKVEFYPPGSYSIYRMNDNSMETTRYYHLNFPQIESSEELIMKQIRIKLNDAVEKRLSGDRPVGCLLSGGIDSSIIASIASLKIPNIKTFSIGLNGSPDLYYAEKVSQHLNTDHTIVLVTDEQMLDAIDRTIQQVESYDITTIRASVPMLLLSEYIRDNTDIKIILSGEGADEASGSYLYFKNAPSAEDFQTESLRLVNDVQYFDANRADKTTAGAGLEIRVPFFDKSFMEYYMSIDPKLKMFSSGIEKRLLREAFSTYLPIEIIERRKDGFSDGVSSFDKPWHSIVEDYSLKHYNLHEKELYKHIYNKYYDKQEIIPYMWLPKWTSEKDPSNRLV